MGAYTAARARPRELPLRLERELRERDVERPLGRPTGVDGRGVGARSMVRRGRNGVGGRATASGARAERGGRGASMFRLERVGDKEWSWVGVDARALSAACGEMQCREFCHYLLS